MQMIDLVPDLRPTILAARELRDARNSLATFLPNIAVDAVSYRLGRRKRLDQAVPVRAIDAPATPIRRPGIVEVKGDLPAITPIIDLSEQDLTNEMVMAKQLAGIPVDWQPTVDAAAGQAALAIDNTLELMRGQLLSTGKVSLQAEDGVVHEVDFGVSAKQNITAASAWTPADALDNLFAAGNTHGEEAGIDAGAILTTRKVRAVLLAGIAAKYPQAPVGQAALSAWLADNGLPDIITYDRVLSNVDGTRSRVLPEGTVVFLPSATDPVGQTQLGITQEAVQQTQRVQPNGATALTSDIAKGITIITLGSDNPVRRSVKGAALGMPVLDDPTQLTIVRGVLGA